MANKTKTSGASDRRQVEVTARAVHGVAQTRPGGPSTKRRVFTVKATPILSTKEKLK